MALDPYIDCNGNVWMHDPTLGGWIHTISDSEFELAASIEEINDTIKPTCDHCHEELDPVWSFPVAVPAPDDPKMTLRVHGGCVHGYYRSHPELKGAEQE